LKNIGLDFKRTNLHGTALGKKYDLKKCAGIVQPRCNTVKSNI